MPIRAEARHATIEHHDVRSAPDVVNHHRGGRARRHPDAGGRDIFFCFRSVRVLYREDGSVLKERIRFAHASIVLRSIGDRPAETERHHARADRAEFVSKKKRAVGKNAARRIADERPTRSIEARPTVGDGIVDRAPVRLGCAIAIRLAAFDEHSTIRKNGRRVATGDVVGGRVRQLSPRSVDVTAELIGGEFPRDVRALHVDEHTAIRHQKRRPLAERVGRLTHGLPTLPMAEGNQHQKQAREDFSQGVL